MATRISVKLAISSQIKLVDLVHAASEQMAEVAGFSADDALNVGLAVREAVINAITHGNKEDPDLEVEVTLTAEGDGMWASVSDHGEGFDRETTADPRQGANLLRESGRGVRRMEAFVDKVEFRGAPGGGTTVTMIKRVPTDDADETNEEAS